MKLNKLFLMGAMGLGLFACSDDLVENGQNGGNAQEGTTYAAITLKFGDANSRGVENVPSEGTATDGENDEKAVKKIRIIVVDQDNNNVDANQLYTSPATDSDPAAADGSTYYFKIQPGNKTFYAIVNEDVALKDNPSKNDVNAYIALAKNGENVQLADAFSNTTNGFTMTGLKKDVKIYEGVASKEEVEQTNVNKVAVDVERVVAKVTVKMASSAENADPKLDLVSGGLELVSLDCQIGNPNLATYGTDNALDGEFAGTYRWANDALGYRSTPYYGVLAGVEEEIAYDATKFLSGTATKLWENKAAIANAVGKFYCLENTHAKGNYKKGNTTFVRVVTEMIPTKVAEFTYTPAEGEGEAKLSAANDEDYTKPNAAEAFYVIKGTPADETKMYDSYVLKSTVVALWKTINSKTEDPTETELNTFLTATLPGLGYTLSDEYVAGKGYYNVWVHDVKDNGVYAGSPVFRNDWYELIITKLTLPGNPSGEFNPEEPTYPDTFIGVTINLLKWNYFRHDVELQ